MPVITCGANGIDAITLHYEDEGAGPVIVWIPGTGLAGATWEHQVARFRDRFRCISVDLRGTGRSSAVETSFSVADLASDVAALLDRLEIRSAVVVGLSLGSAVAQELAISRTDLVSALVLVATWSSTSAEHHIRRHFESRLYALENGPIDVFAQFGFWMSSPWLYDHEPDRQASVERLLRAHMSGTPAGTAAHFRADLGHEIRDRLAMISCSTLVVHGSDDLITLPWYNSTVASLIPNATLEIIDRAGHLAWLERPDELGAVIEQFLARIKAPAR